MKKIKALRNRLPLPGWLFVLVTVLFDELILHLWTTEDLVFGRLLSVALFAMGFGAALGLLTCLLPWPKWQKRAAMTLALLVTVFCLVEYFILDAYQTFMPLSMILDGAGGVASDFLSDVLTLLVRDFWRIILMLLPIVIYGYVGGHRKTGWKTSCALVLAAAGSIGLGFGSVHTLTNDGPRLDYAYEFDSSLRCFGLNMAVALDVTHSSQIVENAPEFSIPETPTEPVLSTQPTVPQTQPAEATEPPVVYGENVLELDFAALAEQESRSTIASIHSYVASQTPSSQNEFTGLFKGKNLILITAEAFSAEVIDPVLTPTLYRLANKGIRFTDYYQPAWGGSTSTGEFSLLTGLVAANGLKSMREGIYQDMFLTMGNQLQDQGYFSAAYHNHMYTFYDRHETHQKMGYDTFLGIGNGLEAGVKNQWPQSDLEMLEYTIPMYIDRQPFSIYYMTVSGHCCYNQDGNAMCRKNYDAVKDMDASERIKCYYAANLELEYAMQTLVAQLEAAGIADDTVIVLGTDHYPYGLDRSTIWGNDKDYLQELYGYKAETFAQRDHSALIIWSGCLEGMDIVVDTPVYSLDVLPTLSNLFGVEYDSRLLVGRDVFSDAEPLVLWPQFTWKTDKGFYDFYANTFTPAEGVTVDEGYVEYITAIVKNKITYSRSVQNYDYFNYVVKALEEQRNAE